MEEPKSESAEVEVTGGAGREAEARQLISRGNLNAELNVPSALCSQVVRHRCQEQR